jgi:suppressor for copper-sensitivity B
LCFTAYWDVNTRQFMPDYMAIEKPDVRRKIRALNIVAMRADGTDDSPEVYAALEQLGERHIPLVAIFPKGRPEDPILLRGIGAVTQDDVLCALDNATRGW